MFIVSLFISGRNKRALIFQFIYQKVSFIHFRLIILVSGAHQMIKLRALKRKLQNESFENEICYAMIKMLVNEHAREMGDFDK